MTGFLGTNVFGEDETPTAYPEAAPSDGGGFLGTSVFAAPPAGTVTTTDGGTFVKRDPLTAANMDEATDIMAANFQGFLQQHPTMTNIIGTVGKVVQPLSAAQQILFTGIKAGQDAFDGDDETNAWETMKRGGRSALSYATWGAYQAAGLGQGDPRAQAITGYELWKKAGAPSWVARWGGTATDFLLDVPLVGAVGKAAKLDGLTAGLRIGENMARTFDSPAAYRAFAGGVLAAPFTTQPIKRLTEAVPRGIREAGRERFVNPILNQRRVPRDITQPVSPTRGQTWLNRNMGVPREVVSAEERKQATLAQYTVLSNEALSAQVEARKGLGFEDAQQLGILTGRLADESNWAKRAVLEGEIWALETRTAVKGAASRAIRSVNKAIQFDVFSAEKLAGSGLMSETALKQYQAGDKRHLRRMYAMYGERPDDQIRRLMERDAPAAVTFDRPKLEGLYSLTLNRQAERRVPPSWSKAAPKRVADFPSNVRNDKGKPVDLLDPVADAERLVWRDVVEPLKVGTVDRSALDLPSQDMSNVRTLKNILGEDAVQRVNGRWRVVGGVTEEFPVGHPDIERIFGDLESQGLAANVTVQEKRFKRQVPNYFNPKDDSPLDLQREYAWRELEESGQVGALYLHSDEISAFMAGATEAEVNAVTRSMERFPIRQQASRNGRGQDDWFPIDPSDPDLKRLIDRAHGGGLSLFDGHAMGQDVANDFLQNGEIVYRGEVAKSEVAGQGQNIVRMQTLGSMGMSPEARLSNLLEVELPAQRAEVAQLHARRQELLDSGTGTRELIALKGQIEVRESGIRSLEEQAEGLRKKIDQTARTVEIIEGNSDLLYVSPRRETAETYANQGADLPEAIKGFSESDVQRVVREFRFRPRNPLDVRPLSEDGHLKGIADAQRMAEELGIPKDKQPEILELLGVAQRDSDGHLIEMSDIDGDPKTVFTFQFFRNEALLITRDALKKRGVDAVRYGEEAQDNIVIFDRGRIAEVTDSGQLQYTDPSAAFNRATAPANMPHLSKMKPNLPSPREFAEQVEKAYTNPDVHPVEFLGTFFKERGMSEQHIMDVLDGIGKDWADRTGIQWRPSDQQVVRMFTRKAAEGGQGNPGGRGVGAVTTQRVELDDAYADVLGQIEDFSTRIQEQARVAGKAASTAGFVQDIRKYLLDNDLIEKVDTADMGSIYKTAGLRMVNGDLARRLGNGFEEGELIPAEIHRILWDEVGTREPAKGAALAWQWFSSRWQGVKLANPASIATNFKSTFVMADQMGYKPHELAAGMADYLRLMKGAQKGDGALDAQFAVRGVTMRELFDNGAFVHNTMFNAEVVAQSNRLMDELANPAGDRIQRGTAALQEWLQNTSKGQMMAKGYATAVTPMRWLGDTYGRVDSLAKGGMYMMLRGKGMKPEQAAKAADEVFFNYSSGVPYAVDGIRKLGLVGMPFVSFKFLATGRFFRSLYQNPYGVAKYYRLPNSTYAAMQDEESTQGNASAYEDYVEGAPDYIKGGLYIPLGKDSQGRHRAVKMDDILPETSVFDAFNADGVAGTVPPVFSLVAQIINGKGYQNRDVYRTGEGFADTWKLDKEEAARGVVKSLWQFGAYPWAPGQPATERLVKAIAEKSVPVESIQNPAAQAVLKVLTEGPAAAADRREWTASPQGGQATPDVVDALVRIFGLAKSYPVDVDPANAGSARYNKQGAEADLETLDRMMDGEMRSATSDEQRQRIRERYERMRAPYLKKLRGQ